MELKELPKLPEDIKCDLCSNRMIQHRLSDWHMYYQCTRQSCKSVIGLPLSKYTRTEEEINKDNEIEDKLNNDYGSGSFKSNK